MERDDGKLSRRDFIKATGAGVAGAAVLGGALGPLAGKAMAQVSPPKLSVEKGAELKVLRWSPFVGSDKEMWEKIPPSGKSLQAAR